MRGRERTEYQEYVRARTDVMRRFAYLTCGDWHRAEDAVQEAFIKLYRAWHRARRRSLDAYTRRIIVNHLIDEHRRGWSRRERPRAVLPEYPVEHADDARRIAVLDALRDLPIKRRAILILRYWDDQSVEQTARIMNCSVHTVKAHTARGFESMRRVFADTEPQSAKGVLS